MLSKPGFDDRYLAESFYRVLFDRFSESFDDPLQTLLSESTFGIAPNQAGVKTLFIVAANFETAKQIAQSIELIIKTVVKLMPGIEQTAVCFVPPEAVANQSPEEQGTHSIPYHLIVGKFFPHPVEGGNLTA